MQALKLICVVGARPNFIKIAPILRALQQADREIKPVLVHTGQHYDHLLADSFFASLNIKKPDYELKVGSGTQAWQTAQIMLRFEKVMEVEAPAAVLVVGDVNSTLACSLVASKLHVPVIHVEAGLRAFDKSMPEEINRLITDQLATMLFTTEMSAKANLLQEGVNPSHIHFVGNVMIDTLNEFKPKALPAKVTLKNLFKDNVIDKYAMLTLHRPSNVDCPETLHRVMEAMAELSSKVPIIFPCHPRTKSKLDLLKINWGLLKNFHVIDPLDYLSMVSLVSGAALVMTDSGGLQEETTALQVPCLTLRYNTERPATLTHGTNQIVGTEVKAIIQKAEAILDGEYVFSNKIPPLWDGQAATRIAQILVPWLYQDSTTTTTTRVLEGSS